MRRDPFLLTPGPLTTSRSTKEAMLHDWGSRDSKFIAMTPACASGCLGEAEMRGVLDAIRDILAEMGVTRCVPAAAEPAGARSPRTI